MYCCSNCFKDYHIRNTINDLGTKGDCDICGSRNVFVIDVSTDNQVTQSLTALFQAYRRSDDARATRLVFSLKNHWDIFNLTEEQIYSLVVEIYNNDSHSSEIIIDDEVIIPQMLEQDYLFYNGVVRGLSWKQFSDYLKYDNRFHAPFNPDSLDRFISMSIKVYPAYSVFRRARICDSKDGFSREEMFAPPKGKRRAGRINPEEMSVLYLSDEELTAIHEIRANKYDYVSIGTFINRKDIKIVDFTQIDKLSPFLYEQEIEFFAVNRQVLKEIAEDVAKPLRRSDGLIEYLPTQYISEYIKSTGCDGVGYMSTVRGQGLNIAVFDESKFECIGVETKEVTDIKYITT